MYRPTTGRAAGYSVVELLISMGVMTVVMGATMAGVSNAIRANDSLLMVTGMNNSLRAAMDLVVRDLLQVGSGLPPGHVILTPSGGGSVAIRIPGPPGTSFTNVSGDTDIAAVVPGPGLGPVVNGIATDVISVITSDNNFTDVPITAITSTYVDVAATTAAGQAVNLDTGPDRVAAGQLMMVEKGSTTALVQVTSVNTSLRRLTFASGDSLLLNQPGAALGTLASLNAVAPVNSPASTRVTRVRMISFYLDTTIARHPRLVRRVNNGDATTFNNLLGTAVALDIENLQFSYDLADGNTNPSGVRFTAADLTIGGACAPNACDPNQIRKVNVALTGRSDNGGDMTGIKVYRNTLTSQVSLRGMAFVDEYKAP